MMAARLGRGKVDIGEGRLAPTARLCLFGAMITLFIHGVPDTPAMWAPLIEALGLPTSDVRTPALPGFGCERPEGFAATKEAYVDWLIGELETAARDQKGPVRIVGHDWGALLTLRAASLRPDLIESWAVSNALIDSQYKPHRMARLWATPLVGEAVMASMRPAALARGLEAAGLPQDLAAYEASKVDKTMRQCILALYRSARGLRFGGAWEDDLAKLPARGLILWGETDPYVPLETAKRFSARWGVPVHIERGAGHWAVVEHAPEIAARLHAFWAEGR